MKEKNIQNKQNPINETNLKRMKYFFLLFLGDRGIRFLKNKVFL